MITGELSNGFKVTIDEKKIKTYRFQKLIGMSASDDDTKKVAASSQILSYLIGEEGEKKLIEYIESQTKEEATVEEVTALIIEIINLMKEDNDIKKS